MAARCGARRQGDPGSTRYFLSLEDNLFRIFGGDRIKGMMDAFKVAFQMPQLALRHASIGEHCCWHFQCANL